MLPKCSLLKDVSLTANEVFKQNAYNASWTYFSSLTTASINYLLLHMVKRNANATEKLIHCLRPKKGRYSALDAMAAPQQSGYKVSRPNSPVVFFSWEMFSQCNCRHSYKHWWYHREIFTRKKEASKYLQAYAFSCCLGHSPFNFTPLWSNVWKYNIYPLSKLQCPDFVPEDRDLMTIYRTCRILYVCFVIAT